ncbi:STAS domain-containing protein [Desulfovibrio sp. OttesenSCG-928-F20]|nr:STAS domain-containing protein [Desulfovibrio sp. OttesenSCG-928-F20]
MNIHLQDNGSYLVLGLTGRLDALSAPDFEEEARKLLEQGVTRVLLDLSKLEFVSSAGLRSILSLAKGLKAVAGSICFVAVRKDVLEVFTFSGFTGMFAFHETLEEAVKALGG